jgi:EvpB/VC_A0108, tail sheath N-terminal domain/Type VI secretion system, VipA, VC_A0107 or Hcp2
MSFQVSFGTIPEGAEIEAPKQDTRFRIAVLADFSGRQNRGELDSLEARRLLRVSRDTIDEVMAKLAVRLELAVGDSGPPISLSFASLDDFHPDQLHDQVSYVSDADESAHKTGWMNWVLHHPDFQALESAWRGLDWLLARSAKGGMVDVLLWDVCLAELSADLMASEDLTATGVHQVLIEKAVRGPSGEPWAAFVGNLVFDLSGEHAELLGRFAKIASQANAPFLTTVNPEITVQGFSFSPDAAPAWQALRQLPEASLLGLSVPRFLLRPPYGESTQPINKFSFEEMSLPPDRSQYLWGNSALGCAVLLTQALVAAGWGGQPGSVRDLENLAIHTYSLDGDEEVTLAEAWLGKPQAIQLVKNGIMLFECVRGKATMRLLRFQSLAQPPENQSACDLQGHWTYSELGQSQRTAVPLTTKVSLAGSESLQQSMLPDPTPAASAPAGKPASKPKPKPAAAAPKPAASAPAAKPAATPAPELAAEEAPVEEEMDPELAALLKQLE